eukprot:2494564-Heterocapsa_arctica.AAC.1
MCCAFALRPLGPLRAARPGHSRSRRMRAAPVHCVGFVLFTAGPLSLPLCYFVSVPAKLLRHVVIRNAFM